MKKTILLILILLFTFTFAGEPTKEDFINNAPKDYDKLLEAYKKMVDFAFQWKTLYEKEAKLNQELGQKMDVMIAQMAEMQKSIDRLEKTVDTLQQIIFKLLGEGKISILGLYDFHSGGFSLGASYRF